MKKKKLMDDIIGYVKDVRDNDGFAVIDINLSDGMLYNPLSVSKNSDLSNDIYDYIDEQANIIPAEVPLKVRFHGDVRKEEQENVRKIMKRHYTVKSYDVLWDLAANFRKMIMLSIIGVAILAVYFYLVLTSDENVLFAEILSIIGSFSLWEAADSFLLERPRLHREHKNIEQNINQVIEFVNVTAENAPAIGNNSSKTAQNEREVDDSSSETVQNDNNVGNNTSVTAQNERTADDSPSEVA